LQRSHCPPQEQRSRQYKKTTTFQNGWLYILPPLLVCGASNASERTNIKGRGNGWLYIFFMFPVVRRWLKTQAAAEIGAASNGSGKNTILLRMQKLKTCK
jgi:hypothetical protein